MTNWLTWECPPTIHSFVLDHSHTLCPNHPQLFMTFSTRCVEGLICCKVLAHFLYQNGFTHVNERDSSGWSPLLYAALGGNPATRRAALGTRKSSVIWEGFAIESGSLGFNFFRWSHMYADCLARSHFLHYFMISYI